MTAEDTPTVGERYMRATMSSNIKLDPNRRTDADILLAAGYALREKCKDCGGTGRLAGKQPSLGTPRCQTCEGWGGYPDRRKSLALGLWRMKVNSDTEQLYEVVTEIDGWLQGRLSRGGNKPMRSDARRALMFSVIRWWLRNTCDYCAGRGFIEQENTGRLSAVECEVCHGTGKKSLEREVPRVHIAHAQWLAAELDRLVQVVFDDMARLLRQRMDLP